MDGDFCEPCSKAVVAWGAGGVAEERREVAEERREAEGGHLRFRSGKGPGQEESVFLSAGCQCPGAGCLVGGC